MVLSLRKLLNNPELQCGLTKLVNGGCLSSVGQFKFGSAASLRKYSSQVDSGKLKVEGATELHWERHGRGPNVVLCCPGLAGSVETNYGAVFKRMDMEKFTFVGVDPEGYGKSRPPDRRVNLGNEFVLQKDARLAGQIMKELGYEKYSTLGWSTGGITATYVGLLYPEAIQKSVVCNPPYKLTAKTKKGIESFCHLNTWPAEQRQDVLKLYGEEYSKKILNDWRMFLYKEIEEPQHYKQLAEDITKVKFPTLYFATSQDPFTDSVNILSVFDEMLTSMLHPIARAGHFHFEFFDEFIRATTKFLLKEIPTESSVKA